MAAPAVQELESPALDATEGASQEAAPVASEGGDVRQPEKVTPNLDEMVEFRQWKAKLDKQLLQERQERERVTAQLQQMQQQTREQRLANMDDYEREKFEKEEARQEAAYYRTQYQNELIQKERTAGLAAIAAKYKVPLEAIEAAQDPAEARDLAWEWREQQIANEAKNSEEAQRLKQQKKENNKVDIGSGFAPTVTTKLEKKFKDAETTTDLVKSFWFPQPEE